MEGGGETMEKGGKRPWRDRQWRLGGKTIEGGGEDLEEFGKTIEKDGKTLQEGV
jgi:hypothetical protein